MDRWKARIGRLRRILNLESRSYAVISNPSNLLYFTGLDSGLLVVGVDEAVILASRLEEEEAGGRVKFGFEVEVYGLEETRLGRLKNFLEEANASTVFYDELQLADYEKLRRLDCRFKPCSEAVWSLRASKDEGEVEAIAKAVEIAWRGLERLAELLKPGVSEWELTVEAEYAMRKSGAESTAFPTIVASSPSSSKPHAKPSGRKISEDDVVVVDLGAVYMGYRSDITRTFLLGRTRSKYSGILEVLRKAKQAGLEAVKPGVEAKKVDAAARRVVEEAGYGGFFIHGLGHGVGLDIHEPPYLHPRSRDRLKVNCVFTVEPGVYLRGEAGFRDEDMYLVVEDGVKPLTPEYRYPLEF